MKNKLRAVCVSGRGWISVHVTVAVEFQENAICYWSTYRPWVLSSSELALLRLVVVASLLWVPEPVFIARFPWFPVFLFWVIASGSTWRSSFYHRETRNANKKLDMYASASLEIPGSPWSPSLLGEPLDVSKKLIFPMYVAWFWYQANANNNICPIWLMVLIFPFNHIIQSLFAEFQA